jgi:Carboxypeptidase regulatory-like domain
MNSRRLVTNSTARIAFPIFILLLDAVWSAAQAASTPQALPHKSVHTNPASYRIAGRTVSRVDSHTLQGATVRIVNTKSQQLVASTVSGEDGSFEFTDLKADKYSLNAVTDGYLASPYDEHENFSSAIVTGAGVDTESLVLRITPAAMINGQIIDEAGDPVRIATVTLYRENREEGRSRITAFRRSQTNDLGAYEFVSLPPGNYFMSARATPWYAVHPQLINLPNTDTTLRSVDSSLDVVYPTTFYADTTDVDGATPIPVRAGNQIDMDMHLQPLPAVTLIVHTTAGQQSAQLQESVFGQPEEVNAQMEVTNSGIFLVGVPPGHYMLSHINQTAGNAKSMAIDLARGNVDIDATSGEESGTVKMHLEGENGLRLAPVTQVALRSKNGGAMVAQSVNDKGEAEFAGVTAGEYNISIYGSDNHIYHVAKVETESGKSLSNLLSIAPGTTLSLMVKVARPSCAIEGFVKNDGKPTPGVMVVLVPAGPDDDIELFRRDQSDLDGSFVLPDVIPGKYTALAIRDGWTLEWGKPEVLAHYLSKGVTVTVSANEQKTVRLSADLIAQPR